MSTSPGSSGRHAARTRDPAAPSAELEHVGVPRGGKAERPQSLREAIARWLNEEL